MYLRSLDFITWFVLWNLFISKYRAQGFFQLLCCSILGQGRSLLQGFMGQIFVVIGRLNMITCIVVVVVLWGCGQWITSRSLKHGKRKCTFLRKECNIFSLASDLNRFQVSTSKGTRDDSSFRWHFQICCPPTSVALLLPSQFFRFPAKCNNWGRTFKTQ